MNRSRFENISFRRMRLNFAEHGMVVEVCASFESIETGIGWLYYWKVMSKYLYAVNDKGCF